MSILFAIVLVVVVVVGVGSWVSNRRKPPEIPDDMPRADKVALAGELEKLQRRGWALTH